MFCLCFVLNTKYEIPNIEYYQPGVQCPPHLSPFVDYSKHGHLPSQLYVIEHWKELAQRYNGFVPSQKLKNTIMSKKNKSNKSETKDNNDENKQQQSDGLGLSFDDIVMNGKMNDIAIKTQINIEQKEQQLNKKSNKKSQSQIQTNTNTKTNSSNNKNSKKNKNKNKNKDQDKFNVKKSLKLSKKVKNNVNKEMQILLDRRRVEIARKKRREIESNDVNNINSRDMEMNNESNKSEYTFDDLQSGKEKRGKQRREKVLEQGKVNLAKTMLPKKHRKLFEKWQRNKNRKSGYVKNLEWKRTKYEDQLTNSNDAKKLYNPKLVKKYPKNKKGTQKSNK